MLSTEAIFPAQETKSTRAIESGANALAESFPFAVATILIILSENYRSSSKQSKRRDDVDDKLENLLAAVEGLQERTADAQRAIENAQEEVHGKRSNRLSSGSSGSRGKRESGVVTRRRGTGDHYKLRET